MKTILLLAALSAQAAFGQLNQSTNITWTLGITLAAPTNYSIPIESKFITLWTTTNVVTNWFTLDSAKHEMPKEFGFVATEIYLNGAYEGKTNWFLVTKTEEKWPSQIRTATNRVNGTFISNATGISLIDL